MPDDQAQNQGRSLRTLEFVVPLMLVLRRQEGWEVTPHRPQLGLEVQAAEWERDLTVPMTRTRESTPKAAVEEPELMEGVEGAAWGIGHTSIWPAKPGTSTPPKTAARELRPDEGPGLTTGKGRAIRLDARSPRTRLEASGAMGLDAAGSEAGGSAGDGRDRGGGEGEGKKSGKSPVCDIAEEQERREAA